MSIRTLAVSLYLAACTPAPWPGELASDTATTSTGGPASAPTTGAPSTTTDDPSTGTTTSTGTTGPFSFISVPDGGWPEPECDPWYETCPFGQKCMPYANDGGTAWNDFKCVTIVPDPGGLYEPCTVFDSGVSGEDTCDIHLMCWDIDPDTVTGTCVGMCVGSPDEPGCTDPATTCFVSASGVLLLCLPGCDPLDQDCSGPDLCIPNPENLDAWVCVIDASGDEGQALDPCEYANACDPGLMCTDPMSAVECDPLAVGCCIPFCDTSLPNTCPGAGQECLPWYEPGEAPPDLEHVGLCALPMP